MQELELLQGTLILCFSPVLNYGLKELSDKLPENCFILGIELNPDLYDFICEHKNDYKDIKNFSLVTPEEAYNLPQILLEKNYILQSNLTLPSAGTFRRVISLNCSAGTQFNPQIYNELLSYCVNSNMTFWKNRITLTKFGRKYCQDFFNNLKILDQTKPIQDYFKSVKQPIIVFGSAESLDDGIKEIKNHSQDYYILCADTALQPLLQNKIPVDGVFIEEAQNVILKAFIGTENANTHIFSGLSAISTLSHNVNKENLSFFTTEFVKADFMTELQNQKLLPPVNPPFGSVGLTTFYYALQFRKDDSVPVYVYGLDFAYTAGRTHAKGTLAHINQLLGTNRLKSLFNFGASYNPNANVIYSKDGTKMYTTPLLSNYASLFNNYFYNCKNCWTSSKLSSLISLEYKEPEPGNNSFEQVTSTKNQYQNLKAFFENERTVLNQIRDILTGKIKMNETELEVKIKELVEPREYLYLHFPDGHQFSYSQDFLNRVRIQLDFFLKIF